MTQGPTCANHKNMSLSSQTKSIFSLLFWRTSLLRLVTPKTMDSHRGKTGALINYDWFLWKILQNTWPQTMGLGKLDPWRSASWASWAFIFISLFTHRWQTSWKEKLLASILPFHWSMCPRPHYLPMCVCGPWCPQLMCLSKRLSFKNCKFHVKLNSFMLKIQISSFSQ